LKLYLGTVDSSNAYRFGDNPVVLEPGESRDLGEIRADRSLLK
jgi:hypothetical protein